MAPTKRFPDGVAAVEHLPIDGIFAVMQPSIEPFTHILDVHLPVVVNQRIQGGEHHARVIRPSAGRLIMRAVSDHASTGERATVMKLVGHA